MSNLPRAHEPTITPITILEYEGERPHGMWVTELVDFEQSCSCDLGDGDCVFDAWRESGDE